MNTPKKCPLCGAAPRMEEKSLPLIFYGMEMESARPTYTLRCSCGYHALTIRTGYHAITRRTLTDEDAKSAALRSWNTRAEETVISTETGLASCPRCGETADTLSPDGRIKMKRVREKERRREDGTIAAAISCGCGAGISAELELNSTEEDLDQLRQQLRERWNNRISV